MKAKAMTGFDRLVRVDGSLHTWAVEEHQFKWERGYGLCLGVWFRGHWMPLVYAKDLRDAGMFAEGFAAGVRNAKLVRNDNVDPIEPT